MSAERIPSFGYELPLWLQIGYRATAIAYMERENVKIVTHQNGNRYTLDELKKKRESDEDYR